MKRLLSNWGALFLGLVVVNLLFYKFGVTLPENPQDYCSIYTVMPVSCIADLPGEFSTSVLRTLSFLIILIYPLLHVLCRAVFNLLNKTNDISQV